MLDEKLGFAAIRNTKRNFGGAALDEWIINKRNAGAAISNQDIKTHAIKLARESGINNFSASNGLMAG